MSVVSRLRWPISSCSVRIGTPLAAMIANGMKITSLQARMGHGSVKTTERYGHLYPDHDAEVMSALDALIALAPAAVDAATP